MGSSVGVYEVFLSFRGTDTRQGLTDILYEYMSNAKIRVFRDDNTLQIGDKIDSIFEAIVSSKICVPIFSPNFVQSRYCLLEVAKMVELKKTIVPIFCNVTTDDVKLKTPLYVDDFQKLEDKYGSHQVDEWKQALKEAVSYKGRKVGIKGYCEFCKEFVVEILSKLRPTELQIDHSDGEAATVESLDIGSSTRPDSESVLVGINGTGGIAAGMGQPDPTPNPPIAPFGLGPVRVLGEEYVSPYPIDLILQMTGWLSSQVTDANGANLIFQLNAHIYPLGCEMLDASGNTLMTLKNKSIFGFDQIGFRGKSTDKKDFLFSIYTGHPMRAKMKSEFYVYLRQNPIKDLWDYRIKGNWSEKSCVIYAGNTNNMVAQVTKTDQLGCFVLTVCPNIDYAFIVSLIAHLPPYFGIFDN